MANREHLKLIKQGVEAWNEWREENFMVSANLRRAKLSGLNLYNADLKDTDLQKANLSGTSLIEAQLNGADLSDAILVNTNCNGADFSVLHIAWSSYSGAWLCNADFTGADLSGANFTGANLKGADLSGAFLYQTVFVDCDLRKIVGLEACIHQGPSILDHQTLLRSGPLPLQFLRGCGLPESLINYLPVLLKQTYEFYSCFISYSSADTEFVEQLHDNLQNEGVRCWFAPDDMKTGERIRVAIDEAISTHDKLLLVLSESSVSSQWVEQEVERALERERKEGVLVLFPIRLDDSIFGVEAGWASFLNNTRNIGDFRKWKVSEQYLKALKRLLRDLSKVIARPQPNKGLQPK